MRGIIALQVLALLGLTHADSLRFRQTWYVPRGTMGIMDNVAGFDVNRDGANELIFSSAWKNPWPLKADSSALLYYSCYPYDRYVLSDSICGALKWYPHFCAIGDADGDSLVDIITKCGESVINGLYVGAYEASDLHSFPKKLVWLHRNNANSGDYSCYITDLDRDGKREITYEEYCYFNVHECTGDNRYGPTFCDTLGFDAYALAIEDFDRDAKTEVGTITSVNGRLHFTVLENTGDDRYEIVWLYADSSWLMPDDQLALPDLDHDGKPEMVHGCEIGMGHLPIWGAAVLVFESIGDNQFQIIFRDSMEYPFLIDATEKRSAFGDIDSDGEVEFVWSAGRDWWVYKCIGGQFTKVHSQYNGNNRCSNTTNLCVYDFNKNGYPEIAEANGDRLKVWEIEGVRLHRPNGGEVITPGSRFPITWEKFSPPGADSFTLLVSFNDGVDYQTITTIRQSDDTLFLWSVPDTLADSCKIMIWAYGPPRSGQQVPRGTAWDFSDSSFAIRRTGVGEDARYTIHDPRLKILQNPTTARQGIRLLATGYAPSAKLQIYDVSGKVIRSLPITNNQSPITIRCDACGPQGAALPAGIYFVRLECGDATVTRKVVLLE